MTFRPIFPEDSYPIVIAGPCSAESKEQVLTTAHAVAKNPQVRYFRAGIWKPRTHPGDFEGVGEIGLTWMNQAKEETGLKITTEVATPQHVEKALKAGIDMLWMGARTTVNPFLVEEIASALKGVTIPMMVKNPVNPDINLWIGALERFHRNGATHLAAIHRGFSGFHKGKYRNEPFWEMIFELRRRFPQLPIITDPSHISGNTQLIPALCQKALDLETDGFIIEVHPSPPEALTDKAQQLTPDAFSALLQHLVFRKNNDADHAKELLEMRTEIDEIDTAIIKFLSHRMELSKRIGTYKRDHQLTILQMDRWKEVVESRLNLGDVEGVKREFLLKILQSIHEESIRIQTEIFGEE